MAANLNEVHADVETFGSEAPGKGQRSFLGIRLKDGVEPRNIRGAALAMMTGMFGMLLNAVVFQNFLITRCGIPEDAVASNRGYLTIFFNLAYLCTAPVWGALSDRVGRRTVAAVCYGLTAAGFLLLGTSGSFVAVAFANVAIGAFASGAMSSTMAAASDYTQPGQRGRLMGTLGTLIGLSISASMLVGFLTYEVHFYLTFALQSAAYLASAALVLRFLRRERTGPGRADAPGQLCEHRSVGVSARQLLQARLFLAYLVSFLMGGGMTLVTAVYFPWGEIEMGASRSLLSAVSGSASLLFTVLTVFAGMIGQKAGRLRLISLGLAGLTSCMAAMALGDSVLLVSAAFILNSIFLAALYPSALGFAATLVSSSECGLSMGVYHAMRSAGEVTFLLLCPYLYEHAGGKGPGFLFPALLAASLCGFATVLWIRGGPDGPAPRLGGET